MKNLVLKTLSILAASALSISVSAQGYPNKPIKFVVPFTAGSATDIVARTVAEAPRADPAIRAGAALVWRVRRRD